MIGVNPPGHFVWDPETTDEQIQHYADLCSKDAGCRDRTDDLAATMRRTASDIPDRWFLPIKEGNVRLASFFGLMESTAGPEPLRAPVTQDSWLSASDGDSSGFWFASFLADFTFPESFVWGRRQRLQGRMPLGGVPRRQPDVVLTGEQQHQRPRSFCCEFLGDTS